MVFLLCYRRYLEWGTSGKTREIYVDTSLEYLTKCSLSLEAVAISAWLLLKLRSMLDTEGQKRQKKIYLNWWFNARWKDKSYLSWQEVWQESH